MVRPPTIAESLKIIRDREKRADGIRSGALNILNLGNIDLRRTTQAEEVLKNINLNSGVNTRKLDFADLRAFKKQMQLRQQDFKRSGIGIGISFKSVIDRSRKEDIKRFQEEINTAIAARRDRNGVITFRVNASARSTDTHHMVSVQFLNFQAALSGGGSITQKLAADVLKGPVRFDCDCGRHRYWYRYLATLGGFAYGKSETGYPKIRNPQLTGLACKHVLYVARMCMHSPSMIRDMQNYLNTYRNNPNSRARTIGRKQAREFAEKIDKEDWRNIKVRQSRNSQLPDRLADAFNPNKKASIRGTNLRPEELVKKRVDEMSKQEKISAIARLLSSTDLPPDLQAAVKLINDQISKEN